jgi:hypothetical protein
MLGSEMQKKKNIRLLVSLVLLSLVTVGVYWYDARPAAPRVDPAMFRVDDVKQLDLVVLESAAGKVELQYKEPRWTVNGTYPADRNMIDVLMATLLQAAPTRPVAGALADSVGQIIEKQGVKVTLSAGGQTLKTFYAGGAPDKRTAFFKLPQEAPYIMAIPGYRVYVSGIFELDASGWRDKLVFGFNWRNFKQLDATYPAHPQENFQVAMDKKYFGIPGIAQVDTAKLNTYLDRVSLLTVVRYDTNPGLTDSLTSIQPEAKIVVTDIANRQYTLSLFRPMGGMSTVHGPQSTAQAGQGMVPGLVGDGQLAWFTGQQIAELLRARSYFPAKAP